MNWILLANSLLVAAASTLVALLLGFAAAIALVASQRWMRRLLVALTVAALALPSFLVTNCWIDLLGVNGTWHRWLPLNIFSLAGAVWILALLLWPVPALAIFSAWQKVEPVHLEVDAKLHGAKLFPHLLLPAASAHLLFSAAIVFALALNNFAVPTILQVKVFTSEVWIKFNTDLDARAALQLSWPLLVVPVCLLLLLRRTEIPWPRETGADIARPLRRQLGAAWVAVAAWVMVLAISLGLITPLAQLAGTSRTWSEFVPALAAGQSALRNSFLYAAGAAALALLFSIVLARWRSSGVLWIFFLMPGVMVGIGALSLFNRPGFEAFSRTAAIVIAVLVLRYVGVTRSMVRAAFGSMDRDTVDAARLDGARGLTLVRQAVLPQIAPEAMAGAYIVYVLCLWDVESILLVIPPGGETLALRIFNLLHYGHNAHVNTLCLLLLLLALAPMMAFACWRGIRALGSSFRSGERGDLNLPLSQPEPQS